MPYAVLAHMDHGFENEVLELWRRIADAGLAHNPETEGLRPHLTLAAYEHLDVVSAERELSPVVSRCVPCELEFSHLGLFLGDQKVIFLAPTVTLKLLEIHRTIHEFCSRWGTGPNPLYSPGQWVPHATVALDLSSTAHLQAISVVTGIRLPITASMVRIGVIEFRPVRHVFTLPRGETAAD